MLAAKIVSRAAAPTSSPQAKSSSQIAIRAAAEMVRHRARRHHIALTLRPYLGSARCSTVYRRLGHDEAVAIKKLPVTHKSNVASVRTNRFFLKVFWLPMAFFLLPPVRFCWRERVFPKSSSGLYVGWRHLAHALAGVLPIVTVDPCRLARHPQK